MLVEDHNPERPIFVADRKKIMILYILKLGLQNSKYKVGISQKGTTLDFVKKKV